MNISLKKLVLASALMAAAISAQAATLSALPAAAAVAVGSTVDVKISINDLIDAAAPSLGAFDLDINFNANVLSYSGFSWGDSVLGDQLDIAQLGSFAQADTSQSGTGKLNFFEISYDDIAALNASQAGEFGLLTLTFNAIENGLSPITITVNALGDAEGNALSAQVNNTSVSAVPLPATLPLFATALLLGLGKARLRKRR